MTEPKANIYTILSGLTGVEVYQVRPEVIEVFPCVTFYVSNDSPVYDLSKDIKKQDVEVTIDIWGNNSKETGTVLLELEEIMNDNDYLLQGSIDIPDQDGYSHIVTKFIY